ncbi:MAG TPA: ABC transporter substrate-binding protein [Candidatus Binatia bacterium]|jgi:NitT/TauT family transport system substrate-binding protein
MSQWTAFWRVFVLAVLFWVVCANAESQERPLPALLQVPSVNVQQIFAYGEARGFFSEQGVLLRIVVIKPHLATATLLSGEVQFTAQFQTAFYAGLRGAPVKALFIVHGRPGWYLVVRPEIKSGKDLKGKAIAVSGLGTSTQYVAMKAVASFGLNPQRDVTYLGVGEDQAKLSAFKSGVVQAIQIGAPWHLEAAKYGGRQLLFAGDILELPTSGLGTSDKLLKENPQLVKRMLRASLRTTREIREHPADFGEFVSRSFKMDREQSILAAQTAAKTITPDGLLSDEAYKSLIEAGIQSGAVTGTPQRDRAVDFTLLREVLHESAAR